MRKETKLGIFAIITIAIAIWGYKYLNGFNIVARTTTVYAIFDRVDGLRLSNPILINGLQVGLVAGIRQETSDLSKIRVTMEIDNGIKIPKTARVELVTTSMMGGVAMKLVFTGTCEGNACVKSGDYIQGVTKGVISSFISPEEMKLLIGELNTGLKGLMDTLSQKLAEGSELNNSLQDAKAILANLRSTTTRLDAVMLSSAGSIENSLKNIESISANLKSSNAQIKAIFANAESLTNDLNKANISGVANEASITMRKLQATLESSEKAIANLDGVLGNLRSGEGTMSLLLSDAEFANNLQQTVKNIDLLLEDIRLHPERYRRILSKKQMPYKAPAVKPEMN
jgi:phospholipid/cholesterol/gamma-HCH transport system substrate-binding protein